MRRKNWELKGIFWIITLLFVGFLAAPILLLLGKSLLGDGGLTGEFYVSVVTRDGFLTALGNSFAVAAASAVAATVIAFLMAYAVHYTELPKWAKRLITAIATLPSRGRRMAIQKVARSLSPMTLETMMVFLSTKPMVLWISRKATGMV